MTLVLDAAVLAAQIGLLLYLGWGALTALRSGLPEKSERAEAPHAPRLLEDQDFRRVASLVLLALFFTTVLALA